MIFCKIQGSPFSIKLEFRQEICFQQLKTRLNNFPGSGKKRANETYFVLNRDKTGNTDRACCPVDDVPWKTVNRTILVRGLRTQRKGNSRLRSFSKEK